MGKAQSKRSVDITTEVKKDEVPDEGTGKMGKIEDVDQLKPQVNGDTHHNESDAGDKEKSAETEGTENEKDLSTEKEQQPTPVEPKANPEGGDAANNATTPTGDKPVENGNGNDDTLNESKNAADTTTENGAESSKKPKKEKVKKKWSLRSISFGKKDKQKPPKKEETAATNGDCEKVPEEASEEPTKTNGDATAEENATAAATAVSTDEKSPAVSPATESKEVITPAAAVDATPAAESTPIVNGSSDHATKDDKPIAEVAPTVVVDEKAPEAIAAALAAEEPPKVDAVPEVAPVVSESAPAAPEPAKQEAPVPAKIEVKAENIADETNENKLEAASSASEQPEQGDINKEENKIDDLDKNIGGDSESAQNLSPPPLPCTSPPSQVTVFALSDDSKGSTESEPLELPTVIEAVPVSDEPTVVAKENTVVLGNAVNTSSDLSEEKTKETNVEDQAPIAIAPENTAASADIPEPEAIKAIEEEIKVEEVGKQESSIATAEETTTTQETPNTQDVQSEPQSAVNLEQIAETIALIDEVTQQAAISVNNQVEVTTSSPSSEQNAEPAVDAQKAAPTEQIIASESDPSNPAEQTPVVPEQQSTSEPSSHVEVDPSLPKTEETGTAQQSSSDTTTDNTGPALLSNEVIGDHVDISQPTEISPSSIVAKDAPIIKSAVTENAAVKADDPIETKPVDELNLPTVLPPTIASELEDVAQVPKSKENGFGENHLVETSATESLNGQSEHKTIEEIKSDCTEKLLSDATTEQAAGAIEVKE